MKNKIPKKGLIVVIIFLLFGTIVAPNINGNIGKSIDLQSLNKSKTNDDYLNSYWKFDECDGTTLSDSAHNYDGTISGATWTNNSYSGCALLFDGIDDYVDFSLHSAEIGFNKTDDIIYSFHFNSSGEGLIYSATASWGNNPAFRIELLSNGTLFFNPWTQNCGIKHYSSNTYNDGIWHHVEYRYNGITTDPTVTLYVDEVLDSIMTHWLCDIEHDEFAKTRIGMHAHSESDYFEGYIDEFKIIKYELGNEQVPPIIDGPTEGETNIRYNYTFITNDPENDQIWLYVDWEDDYPTEWSGPYDSGEEVIIKHKWYYDGLYNITAKSKDIWDDSSWSAPFQVRIGNQAPYPPTIVGPHFGDAEEELEFNFTAEDYEGSVIYLFIDWGDGNIEDWFGPYPSGHKVTSNHSWDSDGDYIVRARAKDINGSIGDWSEDFLIRIGDEIPSVPDIDGPRKGTAGIKYDYTFRSFDPEGDDILFEINWGDGKINITDLYPSGDAVIVSHSWEEEGEYKLRARAFDFFGAPSNWKVITVTMPRNKIASSLLLMDLIQRFPILNRFLYFIL